MAHSDTSNNTKDQACGNGNSSDDSINKSDDSASLTCSDQINVTKNSSLVTKQDNNDIFEKDESVIEIIRTKGCRSQSETPKETENSKFDKAYETAMVSLPVVTDTNSYDWLNSLKVKENVSRKDEYGKSTDATTSQVETTTVERKKKRRRTIGSNRDLKDIVEMLSDCQTAVSTTPDASISKVDETPSCNVEPTDASTSKDEDQTTIKCPKLFKGINVIESTANYFYPNLKNNRPRRKTISDAKDKKEIIGILKKTNYESFKEYNQPEDCSIKNSKAITKHQFTSKETVAPTECINITSLSPIGSKLPETIKKKDQSNKTILTDRSSGSVVEIVQTSDCELSVKVCDLQQANKKAVCRKIVEALYSTLNDFSIKDLYSNKKKTSIVAPTTAVGQSSENETCLENKIELKKNKLKKISNLERSKTVVVEILGSKDSESLTNRTNKQIQSDECSKLDHGMQISSTSIIPKNQLNVTETIVYKNVNVIVESPVRLINLNTTTKGILKKKKRKKIIRDTTSEELDVSSQTSNSEISEKESHKEIAKQDKESNKYVDTSVFGVKKMKVQENIKMNKEPISQANSSATEVQLGIKNSVNKKKLRRKSINNCKDSEEIVNLVRLNISSASCDTEQAKIFQSTGRNEPSIAVSEQFTNGVFPIGEEIQYPPSKDDRTAKDRSTSEEARERERMYNNIYNEARQAAEAHRQTRQFIQTWVKPGMKLVNICEKIEATAKKLIGVNGLKAGLAFPAGCSRNNCAAHYTSNTGDKTILDYDDVTKIDFGTHINGHIIDCAWTLTFNPKYDLLLEAVRSATEAGVNAAGIDVRLTDVGAAIKEVIESYELDLNGKTYRVRPIHNLNGHSILPYRVHGGKVVPLVRTGMLSTYVMEENEFYAIETLGTTGRGEVIRGVDVSHYMKRFEMDYFKTPLRLASSKRLKQVIDTHFGTLAFCKRWLDGLGFTNHKIPLEELCAADIVKAYPPLSDIRGSYSAQFEHTLVLRPTCKEVISRGSDY